MSVKQAITFLEEECDHYRHIGQAKKAEKALEAAAYLRGTTRNGTKWGFETDHNFREKYLLINLEERVTSNLTPERLARVFAEMNSESMAIFFNQLADTEKNWKKEGGAGWAFQLQYVTDEEILEDPARELMQMIGEYGPKHPR